MSKTFCPLPWIHLATRPNGDVRVCCTANASGAGKQDEKTAGLVKKDGIAMNLRDHTIEEVWNSEHMRRTRLQMLNGEVPSSCVKCFNTIFTLHLFGYLIQELLFNAIVRCGCGCKQMN